MANWKPAIINKCCCLKRIFLQYKLYFYSFLVEQFIASFANILKGRLCCKLQGKKRKYVNTVVYIKQAQRVQTRKSWQPLDVDIDY